MTNSDTVFTVSEANQRLPLIKAIVADIVKLHADVSERQDRLRRIRKYHAGQSRETESLHSEELDFEESQLEDDSRRLDEFVVELESLGVELEDASQGQVIFPARKNERKVYLCWQAGEGEVGYWREVESSFSERKNLFHDNLSHEPSPDEPSGHSEAAESC